MVKNEFTIKTKAVLVERLPFESVTENSATNLLEMKQ